MAAAANMALTSTNTNTNSSPSAMTTSSSERMINTVITLDVGHSVDAPDISQRGKPNMKHHENNSVIQETSGSSSSIVPDTPEMESKEISDKVNAFQASDDNKSNWASNYSSKPYTETIQTNPVPDAVVSHTNLLFLPSELSGDDLTNKPNVYWVNTEFARLITDKKKLTKTTEEMRKELKEIGLGDVASSKTRTVEDIMRKYGLEPSFDINSRYVNNPLGNVKSAWTSKQRHSIINKSQNNETLIGSEVDDQKTGGSSVDGDFGYMMRRLSSNSSFANVSNPKETANMFTESKNVSRTPSFSYYDFKSNVSSTNLHSRANSKTNIDVAKIDERSMNPNLYFQRERERLQRLDSVISRTPKASFTNIPIRNSWDFTDSTLSSYKKATPSRHIAFFEMDQGGYEESEKDWGNSSPTRAAIQRQHSTYPAKPYNSAKLFSPTSNISKAHENPIFQDSSSFFPTYSRRPYSRSSSNTDQPLAVSKTARAQLTHTKSQMKQPNSSERSTYKTMNKQQAESSRGQKSMKTKQRQNKPSASAGGKAKSLADVDKKEFISRLMKNYSNSCIMPEKDMAFNSSIKDFISENNESEDNSGPRQISTNTGSVFTSTHQHEIKPRSRKYMPYQQSISSLEKYRPDKTKNNIYNTKTSHQNIPTAWEDSFNLRKNFSEDDSFQLGSMTQNDFKSTLMEDKSFTKSNHENWRGILNLNFPREDKTCKMVTDLVNMDSKISYDSEEPTEKNDHFSRYSQLDLTMDQDKKKSQNKIRSKSVPKKKPLKRK